MPFFTPSQSHTNHPPFSRLGSVHTQLKQYQLDFEEERKAREEMANVMRHLEARDKDSRAQITDLQKQINTLSTEKNYLAFQLEQLRSQLQQVGVVSVCVKF